MTITCTQDLRKAGVSPLVIASRCRAGSWQQVLPGVILRKRGHPTRTERLHAVLAFAPGTIITGVDALREQGAPLPEPDLIHVLQGPNQRLNGQGLVFERTSRPPDTVHHNGLRLAEPHRAAVDAARREPDPMRVLRLLGTAVSFGLCRIDRLRAELDAGTTRGTATARKALTALAHQYSAGSFPSMSRACAFEHT
ncbi:hypothetical protein [Lentzea tibetensis]|uniref:hypothetical protein n=1 Tax=Lentzea tibetensis TaxID=2591470 RepID=UPI0016458F52|nr:hypothetical protein [Lentzea tibetensis]